MTVTKLHRAVIVCLIGLVHKAATTVGMIYEPFALRVKSS